MSSIAPVRLLEVLLTVDHPNLPYRELERLIALVADEAWNVGQTYKPSPRAAEQQYQFSRWAIRAYASSLKGLPEGIRTLADRIRSVESKLSLLPREATVTLTILTTETDTVIGMGINAEIIGLLARIHAGIEISLIVDTSHM
jgi:hypothetical protein